MKYLTITLILLSPILLFAQNASSYPGSLLKERPHHLPQLEKAQKTQTSSDCRPTVYYRQEWITQPGNWDTIERFEVTYHGNSDSVHTELIYPYKGSGLWGFPTRMTYTYSPLVDETREERWDGSNWNVESVYEYHRDANGFFAGWVDAARVGNVLDTIQWVRFFNTPTSFGALDYYTADWYDYATDTTFLTERGEYTYDANQVLTDETLFIPNIAGGWDSIYRRRDYAWFNYPANQAAEWYEDGFINGQWTPNKKFAPDWQTDDDKQYILDYNSFSQVYDSAIFLWTGEDTLNDISFYHNYNWFGEWNIIDGYNAYHFFLPDGCPSETIIETYNYQTRAFENSERFLYTSFLTSRARPEQPEFSVQWLPHPMGQEGILRVQSGIPGPFEVEVFDLHGRRLRAYDLRQLFSVEQHSIQLDLPAGLYVYRLSSDRQATSGRLVVQ